MSEKRPWSEKEDSLLMDLYEDNVKRPQAERLKWNQIADKISSQCWVIRTGKQCRERWHNQLDPAISKDRAWTQEEERILFAEQEIQGNKWSLIAEKLRGRTDNNIKNYFYSTLRKSMRKVNNHLSEHKKEHPLKNIKPIKQQILNKLIAVADNRYDNIKVLDRSEDVDRPKDLAGQLKKLLIKVHFEVRDNAKDQSEMLEGIILKIQEFNKSYKKKKARRSALEHSDNEEIERQYPIQEYKPQKLGNRLKKCHTQIKAMKVKKQYQKVHLPVNKQSGRKARGRRNQIGHSETFNFQNIQKEQKPYEDIRPLIHKQSSSSNPMMSSSYSMMDSKRISSLENSISREYQNIVKPSERENYQQFRNDFMKNIPQVQLLSKISSDLPLEEHEFDGLMGDANKILDKSLAYGAMNGVALKKGLSINSTVEEDDGLFAKKECPKILHKRSSLFCEGKDDSLK